MPEQLCRTGLLQTIRRYSATEQRHCAIIHVLRAIVSNEESVMSPIIIGNESVVRLLRRLRAFMLAIWLAARGCNMGTSWRCHARVYLVASSLVDAALVLKTVPLPAAGAVACGSTGRPTVEMLLRRG